MITVTLAFSIKIGIDDNPLRLEVMTFTWVLRGGFELFTFDEGLESIGIHQGFGTEVTKFITSMALATFN